MSDTSVLELIGQLCDIHLGPVQRAFRVQPTVSRTKIRKHLKRKAYDVLFLYLNNTAIENECMETHTRKDAEGILLEIYKMRIQRKFEDADRLENLFNQLRRENNDDIRQFLKLIVSLKGSDGESSSNLVDDIFNIPETEKLKQPGVLPAGPLCYGDVRLLDECSHFYMHYPKEVFERPFINITRADEKTVSTVFDFIPGTGLGTDCLFTNKFLVGDVYEHATHASLFGSLMQGRVKDLGTQLSLPDLNSDLNIRIPQFTCKKSHSSSQISDESGLGSSGLSMTSSAITLDDNAGYDDSFWEAALTEPRSKHYTWEWIGYLQGPTERPHLTEAGPEVFDILVKLRQRVSTIVCPESKVTTLVTVPSVLVKHILLMLIGIPSHLFPYCQETHSFSVTDNLTVSGTSPKSLASFLSEFVTCGTCFARLALFSRPPVLNSFYTAGLVFQAFTRAIRKFLSHFTAAILKVPQNMPLLNLKIYLLKAMEQMRYVANLCKCYNTAPVAHGDFPKGMKLLTYLYDEAEVSCSSAHYPLLLSIIQTSFSPLVLFIRDWVFHGVFRDFYDEFMIQVDLSCVETRDETYWNRAFMLLSERPDGEGIPQFLRDSILDIVTCGKSIDLLRLCDPQHFMCNVAVSDIPTISITFSYKDLKATEKYCQIYVARMKQIAIQNTDDRQEILRKMEQERVEIQQTARRVADNEIARLQGIIDQKKRKAQIKKRAEFNRLKKQMQEDLKRRADEKEQNKEDEREFIARLNREEHTLADEEIELEKKARDELIAYYTELGEEALHRERFALWRVRRHQLENSRILFLEADAERWRHEMAHFLHGKDFLDSSTQDLPSWATRSFPQDTPVLVSTEEEIILPNWAKQESASSNTIASLGPQESGVVLPKWAQRDMRASNIHTQEVADYQGETEDNSDNHANVEEVENEKDATYETSEDIVKTKCQNRDFQTGNSELSQVEVSVDALRSGKPSDPHTEAHISNIVRRDANEMSENCMVTTSTIKFVQGMNALTESTEAKEVRHTKNLTTMSATKESDPGEGQHKPHLKFTDGLRVTDQSSEERQLIPRRFRDQMSQFASKETEAKVWVIKKPSTFGHISQLSNTHYILTVPKLRRQSFQHANMESDFKDFAIKPSIRMNKAMSASTESEVSSRSVHPRAHIRVFAHQHASSESQMIDQNAVAVQRFRAHNIRGHSSDSTVQRLLYGDLKSVPEDERDGPLQRIDIQQGKPYQPEPYQTEFVNLAEEPVLDLMSDMCVVDLGRDLVDAVVTSEEEVEAYKYTPLSVLLNRSIMAPIRAQISLVNGALINYFTAELKVDNHFEAIRRYLLMADGDFAEILSNILLEKMLKIGKPQEILNPVFLNGALNKAVRSSIHSHDENTHNLTFAITYMPSVFLPNAPNSLNCLELRYNVSWPLNIILTSACMKKYYLVFTFLLQIKRVVWTLKDVWHRLKRDAILNKVGNTVQFRHLQLHRQEMEHFVKMMQGYITNQVILVSWQEFQAALSQPIAGLDQLQALHECYVNKVMSRCLLDKKAEKVMKIIQDIFCLILKFRSQLVSSSWQRGVSGDAVVHPNFANMVTTYKSFHVYSFFLFKVVNRLSQKGYQPHLQELLLQLNFNGYYTEAAN